MSTVPSLSHGSATRTTTRDEVDRALADLQATKEKWAETPIADRIGLAQQCLDGAAAAARDWVATACQGKGIDANSPLAAEEIANGPLATVRYLRLLLGTLWSLDSTGVLGFAAPMREVQPGQFEVPLLPCRGTFDSLLFRGFRASAWMQPHVTLHNIPRYVAANQCVAESRSPGVSLVLGAGNVSSIAPTDAFYKLFHENRVVLLKMNPVNDYLGEIFSRAFRPLIENDFLRIVCGGADIGGYAAYHPLVDDVHITGSIHSHESLVWGSDATERARRKAANDRLLKKPITSELGNVTPWIIVPGPYTERELDFQVENLAASILNNASFNCIASKVIVTHRGWPDRGKFLDKLQAFLDGTPRREAYYPGAHERFRRFAPDGAAPSREGDGQALPWTIVHDVSPDTHPHYFHEESFVCVAAETSLDANSPEDFLDAVPAFCNGKLHGTLGATIVVHPRFRRGPGNEARLWRSVSQLRYGTVAINHWSALGYAIMCSPWGGYPGGTLENPQSGIGWVHNTYMLDGVEKTVIEGPLIVWPKPFWFPTHRTADRLAWKVLDLYHRPSALKLPRIFWTALRA